MDGEFPERHLLATVSLVDLAAHGNAAAVEALCERFRPRLVAWAHGRLPGRARDLMDTEDLVQEALIRSLERLETFKGQEGPSFLAYVMQAIRNKIVDEIRRVDRRGERVEVDAEILDDQPTPLDACLRRETEMVYRAAVAQLAPAQQDLVIGRYELQMSNEELAIHAGLPSAAAARMATLRATRKLAEFMPDEIAPASHGNDRGLEPERDQHEGERTP
jgi:RNA polymerase sigma-70 factor (ECF subfamily)